MTANRVDYWHGGRQGRTVGDFIRSPHERRYEMSSEERNLERASVRLGYNDDRDPKRVYFTIDRELARGWAVSAVLGGGSLYRVRPVPPSSLQPDDDFRGVAFSARRAEVLEVVEEVVDMSDDDAERACALNYVTWHDGTPTYDYDGYFQPPPSRLQQGKTPADYRHLGKWLKFAEIGGKILYVSGTGVAELP